MTKMLDFSDWRILKEINIVSENSHNRQIVFGVIGYLRRLKKDYLLKDDSEENEFLKLLNFPKQNLFPEDIIDEIILNAVKEEFPKSFVRNTLITFNSDLEKIEIITQVPKQIAKLEVRPNFSQVDLSNFAGQEWNFLFKEINIYQHFKAESIKGKYFTGICDFNSKDDIYKKLDEVEFL